MKLNEARKQAFRVAYNRAYKTELRECYASWSDGKQKAYEYQRRLCNELKGKQDSFRILSANVSFFTVGFLFPHPVTGVLMLHIATGRSTYEFEY